MKQIFINKKMKLKVLKTKNKIKLSQPTNLNTFTPQ